MTKFIKLILWWLTFSIVWGLFRLTNPSEIISELIAKPVIWLGITFIAFKLNFLPRKIIADLKANYLQKSPLLITFVIPIIFIIFYFFLINFRNITLPTLGMTSIFIAILINFSTGIVEEYVYRGIMYVWLLKEKSEITAFVVIQVLFLLGHLPVLLIKSESLSAILIKSFFILLVGSIHTLVFRLTKSLYASSITHGIWNTLVYLLLV